MRTHGRLLAVALTGTIVLAGAAGTASGTEPRRAEAGQSSTTNEVKGSTLLTGDADTLEKARDLVLTEGGQVVVDLPAARSIAVRADADTLAQLEGIDGLQVTEETMAKFAGGDEVAPTEPYGLGDEAGSAVFPYVVKADQSANNGWRGRDIGVAIVDTGISEVPSFEGKIRKGVDYSGERDPKNDGYGHGTFIAGLITATADGAGKQKSNGKFRKSDISLIPVKVADRNGTTDLVQVLAGIQWVIDNKKSQKIKVMNLSLGFESNQDWRIDPLNYAVEQAWASGIVVVAAAGNTGNDGKVLKPGDDPYIITVGSSDDRATISTADDTVSSFSAGVSPSWASKPDVVAPGAHLVSYLAPESRASEVATLIGDDHTKGSGTSFSAGVVTGTVVQMLSRNPALTPGQVKARLMATATPIPGTGAGKGIVDSYAATTSNLMVDANAGLGGILSDGSGSMQATRGSSCIQDATNTCVADTLIPISFDRNGEEGWLNIDPKTLVKVNPKAPVVDFLDPEWMARSWHDDGWEARSWHARTWHDKGWVARSWHARAWHSTSWLSSRWE